jgi:hypothetical protein
MDGWMDRLMFWQPYIHIVSILIQLQYEKKKNSSRQTRHYSDTPKRQVFSHKIIKKGGEFGWSKVGMILYIIFLINTLFSLIPNLSAKNPEVGQTQP